MVFLAEKACYGSGTDPGALSSPWGEWSDSHQGVERFAPGGGAIRSREWGEKAQPGEWHFGNEYQAVQRLVSRSAGRMPT
ncbi:MAG: hypothetical protein RLZZ440_1783, partial [Planctomycetota bacterium]